MVKIILYGMKPALVFVKVKNMFNNGIMGYTSGSRGVLAITNKNSMHQCKIYIHIANWTLGGCSKQECFNVLRLRRQFTI